MKRGEAMALVLLGAWLAMTLCMWFAATGSFATVRRVLEGANPQTAETATPLAPDQARMLLRHLASEINRTYFRAYGWAQLALGVALLLLLLGQIPRDRTALIVAAAMLVLAVVLTLYITPEVIALGRRIDFVPRDPAPPEMPRFRVLHGAFTILDGMKFLLGLSLLLRWIWKR